MRPKLHTDALKVWDEFSGREMFRAIKGHMLEKMGQSPLIIRFIQRAGPYMYLDGHLSRRIVVLAVHPTYSIIQLARLNARIIR